MNKYFSIDASLAEITESYPELIPLLVQKGFAMLNDEKMRNELGSKISLKQAARMKGLDLEKIVELMVEEIEIQDEQVDITLKEGNIQGDIRVEGLLPCPVRIPLLEELQPVTNEMDIPVSINLKAASQGLDWLKEELATDREAEDLADIFLSAGFDLFFDRDLIDRFRRQGVFKDSTGIKQLNKVFKDDHIDLLDPAGDYSVLAVVPAVFLINREELGNRPLPRSWQDLLTEEFARSVSLPISDFDLFNAILINIYKNYGREGIDNLARALMKAQHPSQMVKEGGRKKAGEPAVTIMPYFFTRMAKRFPHMEFVWPEDGAIISPIFMLTKRESLARTQPLIDFFASQRVGEILGVQGLFPSVLPEVDNGLKAGANFMWPGWDYLRQENIGELIKELIDQFNQSVEEVNL